MPALSAARHDPNVRAFYRHLINTRGLKELQAVCTVMRKLLLAIHAMLRTNSPFDSSRFYSPNRSPTDRLPISSICLSGELLGIRWQNGLAREQSIYSNVNSP